MERLGEKNDAEELWISYIAFCCMSHIFVYDLEIRSGFILEENTSRQAIFAASFGSRIIVE